MFVAPPTEVSHSASASAESSVNASLAISLSGQSTARVSDRQDRAQSVPLWLAKPGTSGTAVDLDMASLRETSGIALLAGLSQLPLGDIRSFVTSSAATVDAILAAPPAPATVNKWWDQLDSGSRADMLAGAPRLVGNLDGIGFRERGRANEKFLSDAQDALEQSGQDASVVDASVLDRVTEALQEDDGPERSLIFLDPTEGGKAAIAIGNPDTADYIGYLVPGMNYGVKEQLVNWTRTAEALYAEQRAIIREAGETANVAVIAWIGYETPDLFSVGGSDHAQHGADALESSWLGIRSSHESDQPFISVYAHSYGTTAALIALARGSVTVDALVMVGSPGSEVQSADELSVSHGNVFVGEADWDPAVNSAFFGSDPGSPAYGAKTLGVSGAKDRITGKWLGGSIGHNEYFVEGSESLHNMALVGTGNEAMMTQGTKTPASSTAEGDWAQSR